MTFRTWQPDEDEAYYARIDAELEKVRAYRRMLAEEGNRKILKSRAPLHLGAKEASGHGSTER
jgi:hypothetical protein